MEADEPEHAVEAWARTLDANSILGLGLSHRDALITGIESEPPTPIEGLTNVWSLFLLVGDAACLVHLVQSEAA